MPCLFILRCLLSSCCDFQYSAIMNIQYRFRQNQQMLTKYSFLLLLGFLTSVLGQGCTNNQFLFQDTCVSSCPPQFAAVQANGLGRCEECDAAKFLIARPDQSSCECALQTYYIPYQGACAPCHYSCLTCTGPSDQQCQACSSQTVQTFRISSGGFCLCTQGYIDVPALESIKCTKCHQDCVTCTGPSELECNQCVAGKSKNSLQQCVCDNSFVQDEAGNCVCPLPLTSFPDGICKDPITTCGLNQQPRTSNIASLMAFTSTPSNCKCQAGFVRIKGVCTTCKPNHNYNQQRQKCDCQGIKVSDQCIVCPGDQVFNRRSGECDCKKGTQKTEYGTCYNCPAKSVYKQMGTCECIFNYYLASNGKCRRCTKRTDNVNCADSVHNIDKPRQLGLNQIFTSQNFVNNLSQELSLNLQQLMRSNIFN